jgi:hypothetical protein|nr:MAG TPA: tail completion protein [Caudoviricetes sp.]
MVNELLNGISIKLNQVFGDGYEIYGDTDVVQGLKEPCFFIAILNPSQTKLIGQRYFREHPFDVQFFPTKSGDNVELQEVASELFLALEYITLLNGDLVHGTSMNYENVDGVLHFKVNYNMFLRKVEPKDNMGDISIDENTI